MVEMSIQKIKTWPHRLHLALEKARPFQPLVHGLNLALIITMVSQAISLEFEFVPVLRNFLGAYFAVFGLLKLINIKEFAKSFAQYDVVAGYVKIYAYAYPLLELILAVFYFTNTGGHEIQIAAFTLVAISALSIRKSILEQGHQGKSKECVCAGSFFKMPMANVILYHQYVLLVLILGMLWAGQPTGSFF